MRKFIKKRSGDKSTYLLAGLVGGFTATTCCIAPIVIVLLGFGTVLGMAVMHQFHIISIVSGVVFMALLSLYLVKRNSGVCNMKTVGQNWKPIGLAAVTMVVSLVAINYLIIAPVAGLVYGNLEIEQKPLGNLEEMAELHDMAGMAAIEVVPENQGKKILLMEIEGVFCGSCGPAIEYDIRSVQGVLDLQVAGAITTVTYDSDVTSKDMILAAVHDPYTAKYISDKVVGYE